MKTDQIVHNLKAIYLVHNPFQLWAWVLSACFLLFLIKPTRRFGGTSFAVALVCMGIYFSVMNMMNDFAPKKIDPKDLEPPKAKSHRPW